MLESKLFRKSSINANDEQVCFVRSDPRPGSLPILMVHGAIVSHLYFLPAAELISREYEVIIPDLPGHGQSSKPQHALKVQQQAIILEAFVKQLNIPKLKFPLLGGH